MTADAAWHYVKAPDYNLRERFFYALAEVIDMAYGAAVWATKEADHWANWAMHQAEHTDGSQEAT